MALSSEEQADLDVLHAAMTSTKMQTMEYLLHVVTLDRAGLDMSGFRNKSVAEACEKIVRDTKAKLEKLGKDHVKKWPD